MAIFAGVRRHHILTGAALGVLMSNSLISQTSDIPLDPQAIVTNAPGERKPDAGRKQAKQPALITLAVKDSTISYVIDEIIRQSGAKVIFDRSHKDLKQKVVTNISEQSAIDAINSSLVRTALIARHAPDGKAIIIGARKRGALKDTQSVSSNASQQGKGTVSGVVVDSASGKPVQGVAVHLIGGDTRAITDEKGAFTLQDVSFGEAAISFRLLGYASAQKSVKVASGSAAVLKVMLQPTATTLGEIVTTATGQQRRVEVGNDIVKINAAEILERSPARSVSDMLRYSQVPGVQVLTASGDPGAPTRIRMRGIGSITQNTDPVIIVDGMWVNSNMSDSSIINRVAGGGYSQSGTRYSSSPLDEIDPSIIETIEIVRGPSAASLYGQEAANGVIVITTKRGRSGTTSWSSSFSRDWDRQVRAKYGEWVPYGTSLTGAVINNCNIARHYSLSCSQDSVIDLHRFGSLLDETGPASSYRYNIAVRGGMSNLTYSFSASYHDHVGTRRTVPADLIRLRLLNIPVSGDLVMPSGNRKLYLSSSVAFTPNRSLSFDVSVNASSSNLKDNGVATSGNTNGIRYGTDTLGILDHASASVNVFRGGSNNFSIQSGLAVRYSPGTWWNANAQIGIDRGEREDFNKIEFRECNLGTCAPMPTDGLRQARLKTNVLTGRMSATGVVSTRFDRLLSLRPSIGLDVRRNVGSGLTLNLRDVPFGADQFSGSGSGSVTANDVVTAGYYVSAALKFLDRMHFDVGFRQDAGSVIKMNSASRYPKLATSWLVSDEGFFPINSLLSLFRLRGAVGYAAVHPEAADLSGGYQYSNAFINGRQVVIGELSTIGNNRLVPERSLEMEGGFDADLLDDRVQLVFTIANKTLRNAIVVRDLPVSSGLVAGGRKENVARVDNRSVELSINGRLIDNDAMLLQVQSGITNVNNIIRKLGDRVLPMSNTATDRLVEGYQVGAVWERPVLSYGDVDKNGYIDRTEVVLGDTTVYKGWSSPKLSASYGASLSVLDRSLTFSFGLSHIGSRVQRVTYQDNYGSTVVGAPIEYQAFAVASSVNRGATMSVSEVRLMNMTVNYNLPMSVAYRLNAKLISVSLQGGNLGLWTNYSGRDPMINSSPVGNAISDNGFTLPIPRRYAFNVRLEL